jgi:hypothetical protein
MSDGTGVRVQVIKRSKIVNIQLESLSDALTIINDNTPDLCNVKAMVLWCTKQMTSGLLHVSFLSRQGKPCL